MLFQGLKGSNRRNIRKALKDGVSIVFDGTRESLEAFYGLHCSTRKRHGLPPQPFAFFRNIRDHVLAKGLGTIVSAHYNGHVIASAVFFHFGKRAIFKYGASDGYFLCHRPNNLIMWETMKWYRGQGFKNLNLGRTESDNRGLLQFKRSWGGTESVIQYYRYDLRKTRLVRLHKNSDHPNRLFARAPVGVLRLVGRLFYKHIG